MNSNIRNIILIIFVILLFILLEFKNKVLKKEFFDESKPYTLYDNFKYSKKLSISDIKNLKKSQVKMTDILRQFDRICRKHNLKYWCCDGTLLGAIRHKGWIPYDGDIDVGMLDKDYTKLSKVIQKELPKNMWLQDKTTDTNYKLNIPKIRDLNSCYIGYKDESSHNGLQLDIFLFQEKDDKICYMFNKTKYEKKDILPLAEGLFEDINVYIPNESEIILKKIYGDNYMNLLPVNKRYPHESDGNGKFWPDKTCHFHLKKYPQLYENNKDK